MTAHEKAVEAAMATLVRTNVSYPDGMADQLLYCFKLDEHDAVDFGILKTPHWANYSDIAIMQQEAYIAAVLKAPFAAAISAYLASMREQGWVMRCKEPTDAMITAGAAEIRLGATEKWSPEVTAFEVHDAMLAAQEG